MEKRPRQGDVYWVDLGEASGVRPVVILTRTQAIGRLSNVTVAPITSTIRGIDTEVEIELPTVSGRRVVSLDNIITIEKRLLIDHLATLANDDLDQVFGAIHAAFDMPF